MKRLVKSVHIKVNRTF